MEARLGTAPQLMGFTYEKRTCTAGQPVPASVLMLELQGTAIPLECVKTGENGVVINKMKFVWLPDLGVGFQTDYVSARETSLYTLHSLDVTR